MCFFLIENSCLHCFNVDKIQDYEKKIKIEEEEKKFSHTIKYIHRPES